MSRQDLWCVNCKLNVKSFLDLPVDCPLYFCSGKCAQEWVSKLPLQNLLDVWKRRSRDGTDASVL
jgi:hypothetical protein